MAITVPMLSPSITDLCFFRRQEANAWGLFSALITPGELARFHGIDERVTQTATARPERSATAMRFVP